MSRSRSACGGSRSSLSTKSTSRSLSSVLARSRRFSRTLRWGLLYAGDPGVPRGGHPTKWDNVAPRMAVAWRLNQKTSLRTAYGIFHDTARFFHYPKTLVFTPPYSISRTTNDVQFSDPYRNAPNPYPYPPPSSSSGICDLPVPAAGARDLVPGRFFAGFSQQWNVNLQRDLGGSRCFGGVCRDQGAGSATSRQINPAVYGPGATLANRQQRRMYPQFEGIRASIHSADPIHGLQLSVNKRFSRGYSILANYTFSKARDNASADDGFSPQDPLDPDGHVGSGEQRPAASPGHVGFVGTPVAAGRSSKSRARRLAAQQHRHACSGHAVYREHRTRHAAELPDGARQCIRRADVAANRSQAELIARYFDPTVFSIPVDGTAGNTPRNFLIGPGSRNVDLSLFRTFALQRNFRVQLRLEAFNAFNFVNLGNPQGTSPVRPLDKFCPQVMRG